ncbi:MAG: hypothetical protein PHE56_08250 [Bacteroidales bacterium]|jgi:hypothetical protein|nr:hypothetical protein [Bacteroidales bacterium]
MATTTKGKKKKSDGKNPAKKRVLSEAQKKALAKGRAKLKKLNESNAKSSAKKSNSVKKKDEVVKAKSAKKSVEKKQVNKQSTFKRKSPLEKLYEVYFNNDPERSFDRVGAKSKEEAGKKMQRRYPNDKVTGSKLL